LEMQGKLAIHDQAEVLTGFEGRGRQIARRLLDRFPLLIIDRPIADPAATLRRQNRWKMPDALQAALARHHKLRLALATPMISTEAISICNCPLLDLIRKSHPLSRIGGCLSFFRGSAPHP
jgi:hypothetical protein